MRAPRLSRRSSSDGTSPVWARLRSRGRDVRTVEVDGVRLRVAIRGSGRPLLLLMGIGGNLEMWGPFEDALDAATRADHHRGRTRAPAAPARTGTRAGCRAWPGRWTGWCRRSATTRSTCSASRSAACSPSSWPARRHTGCAGWCSRPPAPGSAAFPARPASCWALATPRRYTQPDYFRRIAGTIYGGAVRDDPDAILHGSLARFTKPPSMSGYLAQLFAITGWTSLPWLGRLRQPTLVLAGDDDPIVPLVNGRMLARLIPDARLHVVRGRWPSLPARTAARDGGARDRVPDD